jgi:hypothetical protein
MDMEWGESKKTFMIYFRQLLPLSPEENYEIIGWMTLTGKNPSIQKKKP